MRKVFISVLIAAVFLSMPALASGSAVGGWKVTEDAAVSAQAQAVFDKAVEGLTGADYETIALLSTQVVAGTNYCFLCRVTPVYPDPESSYAFVYVYEDLQGNASILEVKDIDFGLSDSSDGTDILTPDNKEQDFSPYDFITGETGNGKYLTYTFPDLRLFLPAEWEGRFLTETDEHGVSFYQKATHDRYLEEKVTEHGGFLFQLRASEDDSFRSLPAYREIGFSDNAGLYFYLKLPTDYRAYNDPVIRDEYDEMMGQIDLIAEKSEIRKSMHFYTDGIESTDPGMS